MMDEVRVPRGGRAFRTGVRAGTSSHCTVSLLARGGRVRQVLGVVGLDVAGRAFADALHVGRTVTLLFGALVPFPAVSDEGRSAGDVARAAAAEVLRAFDAVPSGARPGVFREGDRIAVRMRRRDGRVDFAELDAGVLRTNVHEVMFARP
jgi:hypothetical protein